MTTAIPRLLALDFDGVICDGLIEYFQVAWKVYRKLWTDSPGSRSVGAAEQFYRLRPVVEIGWEMPLLVLAIVRNIDPETIFADWRSIAQALLAESGLNAAVLGEAVDSTRDEWIDHDPAGWLSLHRLYPGVAQTLHRMLAAPDLKTVIITTKESRFVSELLLQANLDWPRDALFGKDVRQSKSVTLGQLQAHATPAWFVEDRLATLELVSQVPELADVRLYLADWGYNTPAERERVRQENGRIRLIGLEQFAGGFESWPGVGQ